MGLRVLLALLSLGLTGACHLREYEARPLDPAGTAAVLAARRLDDPGLATFVRANGRGFPPDAWELDDLTLAAFFFRSELDVARAALEGARASVVSAGVRPNPSLVIDPEAVPGATHPWILGFTLELPIETAGKRGRRVRVAEADARTRELELYADAWRIRAEVAAARAELATARAEERLLADELALRGERHATLARRLEAGRDARGELAREELDEARTAAELASARVRTASAWTALAGALGLPAEAVVDLPLAPDPSGTELPEPPEPMQARELGLGSRLDLFAGLSEYARSEAALELEIARQIPDFRLGPGTSWDQGDHKYALGLALELPLFDRNQGPIAEAEARRAEVGARFLALQQKAIAEIDSALAAFGGARREAGAAREVFTAARTEAERQERVLRAGGSGRLEWLDARLLALAAERTAVRQEQAALHALNALEDALQRPLERSFDPALVLEPR